MGMLLNIYESMCDQFVASNMVCQITLYRNWDFNEFEKYLKSLNLQYITSSVELCDSDECGDYLFYYGEEDGLYFIYSQPTHPFAFPARISIFDSMYEYSAENALGYNEDELFKVYQCNQNLFTILSEKNENTRKRLLFEWMKNTDRPSAIPF